MPEIISLTFKNNSVALELENSEKLEIPYVAYTAYKISRGMNLSPELYSELLEESQKLECLEKALNLLDIRSRSVEELRRFLKKKNFSGIHIEDTLEYLKQKGYLNDYDFSLSYIKEKMKNGKSGKDLIIRDLYRKGIGKKTINKAIKETGADIPDENAIYELASKKLAALKGKGNSFMQVSNFLRGRGFDYETINRVLRKIRSDFDE